MNRLRPIAALALVFLVVANNPAKPLTPPGFTVVVENLRSDKGDVRVALWSDPDGFTEPEAAIAETGQKAQIGQVTFRFAGLPAGRYAIASFHDENGNGDFDLTFLGLPKEGLGFSNGAWIGLGPPAFDDAAVEVNVSSQVIVVKLRY
ncbi:MAG: DUF2141 domain-containing protein [Alphaproteobacteria bacterium]